MFIGTRLVEEMEECGAIRRNRRYDLPPVNVMTPFACGSSCCPTPRKLTFSLLKVFFCDAILCNYHKGFEVDGC